MPIFHELESLYYVASTEQCFLANMSKCGDEQQVSYILPDQHLVDPK
jgi:hypothetical protein